MKVVNIWDCYSNYAWIIESKYCLFNILDCAMLIFKFLVNCLLFISIHSFVWVLYFFIFHAFCCNLEHRSVCDSFEIDPFCIDSGFISCCCLVCDHLEPNWKDFMICHKEMVSISWKSWIFGTAILTMHGSLKENIVCLIF